MQIDLNSDMGEAFGAYRMGDDDALMEIVTSANIACGFHGGDPEVMAHAFGLEKASGVAVGAHPGYADLWGFGRRAIPHSAGEIERLVAYQIGAAMALSTYSGHPITYVKVHGALGNQAQSMPEVADAVISAIMAVDPGLMVLLPALGHQERVARERGLVVKSEIYADRAYMEDGSLTPRNLPGAVIHDPEYAAFRVLEMLKAGALVTSSGSRVAATIDSVCLHSDTPAAIEIARSVRSTLAGAGIRLKAFS